MDASTVIFVMLSFVAASSVGEDSSEPPLLTVICVNGFRWDYFTKYEVPTPMFDFISSQGVRAKYVKPIFPAKPVPNAMAMVTGLYAESHGFVGDTMYDPHLREKWTTWSWPTGAIDDGNAAKSTRWFDNVAEPVWLTNAKYDISRRRSGIMMWPLGRIDFPGENPNAPTPKPPRYRSYNSTMPYIDRIDQLIDWFTDKKSPINFGLVYLELLDKLGHEFGPGHPQIREGLFVLDTLIGYFFQRLNEVELFDNMNLMIVSGHGMSEIKDTITLTNHIPISKFEFIDKDQIWPKPGYEQEIVSKLSNLSRVCVIKKENLDSNLHFRNNIRAPPLTLRWDDGWVGKVHDFETLRNSGDHGFSPSHRNMRSVFFARGPAFKKGVVISNTELTTVDFYPLMCRVLRIWPADNNGTYEHIRTMIADDYPVPTSTAITFTTIFSSSSILFPVTLLITTTPYI